MIVKTILTVWTIANNNAPNAILPGWNLFALPILVIKGKWTANKFIILNNTWSDTLRKIPKRTSTCNYKIKPTYEKSTNP